MMSIVSVDEPAEAGATATEGVVVVVVVVEVAEESEGAAEVDIFFSCAQTETHDTRQETAQAQQTHHQ
jgi:hypothetical protein